MSYQIVVNAHGYREAIPKPTPEVLAEFYARRYFQEGTRYAGEYGEAELHYIQELIRRKAALLLPLSEHAHGPARALEVGVGEGWTLQYLLDQGLDVTGIDFSGYACKRHNSEAATRLRVGAPDKLLAELAREERVFELMWIDNVLEHTPDPARLLQQLRDLAGRGAQLVIEVPNDYSALQLECQARGLTRSAFWEAVPEHLSYFNREGLANLAAACGWRLRRAIADFPIDLFLLNRSSNYSLDPSLGCEAHQARIAFDTLLARQPLDKVLDFYEKMLDLGLGRQIVAVFDLAS